MKIIFYFISFLNMNTGVNNPINSMPNRYIGSSDEFSDENRIDNTIAQRIENINNNMNNQEQQIKKLEGKINQLIVGQISLQNQIKQLFSEQQKHFNEEINSLKLQLQQLVNNNNNQINNDNNLINNNNNLINENNPINNNIINNNVLFFKDGENMFTVECNENDKVEEAIKKYRDQANNHYVPKIFVFDGVDLDPNLTCKEAKLINYPIIDVYNA